MKLHTWAILCQMTCLMTRISVGSVGSCMHKQTCSAVGLVCALYLLKSHSFERIVRRCILPNLWCRYKQGSIRKLTVAYNDSMRLLLRAPRSSSASQMFVSVGVPTCSAVLRGLMYGFMCRASESENNLIAVLANPLCSSVRFSSRLWNHWRSCLYARH